MEEIIREINIMKMVVVVLTETKKKGTGSETLRNYIQLFAGRRNMKGLKEDCQF